MDSTLIAQFFQAWEQYTSIFSLLLLQAAGLVGILAVLLIFRGSSILSSHLGLILGGANLLLGSLIQEWIQEPSKPYLRNDALFLAGFFGGWRHAVVAFVLTFTGRILFGGIDSIFAAFVDIFLITVGSVLLRKLLKDNTLETITHRTIAKLICLRAIVVTFPVLVISLLITDVNAVDLALVRLYSNFSISVVLIYAVIFLLRRETIREKQEYIDIVSALPNRRALQKDITRAFEQRQLTPLPEQTLLLIEIDNLYELIQEHDHDWADNYFRQFGKTLETLTTAPLLTPYKPALYSFSDRSFALILRNISMKQVQANELAEAILGSLFIDDQEQENPLQARLTIGAIRIELNQSFSPSWFLRALNSMERNAHARVHYFESTITAQMQLDNRLRIQIEQWIEQGNVPLWLQPKICLKTRECIGAEALLRTQDGEPADRYIAPPHVISIATKHHLLADVEWAGIRTIVRYIQSLPKELEHLKFSVNISPYSLTEAGFGKRVCALLSLNTISGNRLAIEVIETSELPITETVQDNVSTLLQYGIALSLDDFGSGYASLTLLTKLPFSELKLDYAMISSMHKPRTRAAIMLALNGARQYSAQVVAEGIETEEQLQQLLQIGVEHGQGFLFSRAVPFDDFVTYAQKTLRTRSSGY